MKDQNSVLSIAVVLHISNLDLWPQYWTILKQLPPSTSFFISTTLDKKIAVALLVHKDIDNAQFYAFEGRGRDFGALISLLKLVPLHQFDLVLKLHTGNTDFYSDMPNEQWLLEFINSLTPKGRLNHLHNYFRKNSSVGIVGPVRHHWPLKKLFFNENSIIHWNNLTKFRKQSEFPSAPFFIAGGMYWARGSIFKGFADLNLSQSQFEIDSQELDGTLAHTLERFVAVIAHDQNLTVEGVDFSDFNRWLSQRRISDSQKKQFERFITHSPYLPTVLIIVQCQSNDNSSELALSLKSIDTAKQCGIKVVSQVWKQSNPIPFSSFVNALTLFRSYDWLLILRAGDELTPYGLIMAYVEMIKQQDKKAIYTDKMIMSPEGGIETAFLPDFNHDLLISFPWLMSNHWFFKCTTVREFNGFDESTGQFFELDIILRLVVAQQQAFIHHLAEPLLITPEPKAWIEEQDEFALVEKYIVDSGYPDAQVIQLLPRLYRALYLNDDLPLVSIIIPNQDIYQTQKCLESLLQNTSYNQYEILIVDNRSKDRANIAWLNGLVEIDPQRFRIVFNSSSKNIYAMYNAGAEAANGELLVFADSSAKFIESSWLEALVNHGQRPKVGAVGVKMVDSYLNVYSAGLVLGMIKGNENTFVGERFDDIGYLQRLRVDQTYSAMSSRCLMVRKSHFDSIDGFKDSQDRNAEIDIDFCLRLKSKGLENIWTPYALVQVNPEITGSNKSIFNGNLPSDTFLRAWLPSIAFDSAYNKNLTLREQPFSVELMHEINWRPLSWRPSPVILAHPSDDTGCGQYRVIKPLTAMMQECIGDGIISLRALVPAELERIKPDTIIFQRPLARDFLDFMKYSKTYSHAFKVYEIDDLITNIPLKNHFKAQHPKDTVKLLREGIAQVDRLIVSTPGLAEEYSSLHSDTKIVELKLPLDWWGNLKVNRTEHSKPRVGWAGGSSHLGDLELIADVVKDLADKVDWIFFGMCPRELRPYLKEYHNGVPIHMYPQKLASLDLDLALAPLENNQFNNCKSNLRLLEYGACGFPVICSNTRAYTESQLPVQIVKNKFKDWTDAILQHTNDLNSSTAQGAKLKEEVHRNWMLQNQGLQSFFSTWIESDH